MKYATIIARVLLGLPFLVFGLDGFLHFIPVPPLEGDIATLTTLLSSSGWLKLVKGIEVVGGLMILLNLYPAVALSLLGPVLVNIVTVHVLFAPEGLPVAIVLTALEIFLIWVHRDRFAAIFKR